MIEIEHIFRYLLAIVLSFAMNWFSYRLPVFWSACSLVYWFDLAFCLIYKGFVVLLFGILMKLVCYLFYALPIFHWFVVCLLTRYFVCLLTFYFVCVWTWVCIWIKAAEKSGGLFKAPKHTGVKRIGDTKRNKEFSKLCCSCAFFLLQES